MRYRFDGFELDEERRCLRSSGGDEIALQPRTFDLLACLLRNRHRVSSKDELVSSVWAGAFVTDGAVQRAVSVLRRALRGGDGDGRDGGIRIRTYPRQGYRLDVARCEATSATASEAPPEASGAGGAAAGDALERARRAFARGDWAAAVAGFGAAAGVAAGDGLGGDDLERWGEAAELAGDLRAAPAPLQRAVAAHAAAGASGAAGRAALRLANVQLELRETAVASGWLRRAAHHLADTPECHEVALLAWLRSRFAFFAGELSETLTHADAALELARRLGDPDVEALALLYRGLALLTSGEVRRGVALLDESAAAVLGAGVGAWTGGVVYCGVIWGSLNRGDWQRAAEWTDQFGLWCDRNAVCGYPGLCRLHRAEVLGLRGLLHEAEREAEAAAAVLSTAIPIAEGDAHRVLGELRLFRGDLVGAETAFRRAHELGWDPNPGYALLQLERGEAAAALRSLEGALAAADWPLRQRRAFLLGHLVTVAIAAGEPGRARRALAELEAHPELCEPLAAAAVVRRARGELALTEGRAAEAVGYFREALQAWRELGSPCRMAAVRLRLAAALGRAGDPLAAEREIAAAEATFGDAGLVALLATCADARQALVAGDG